MDNPELFFQYCPKIVLFSANWQEIFLARRTDEADYDGVFAFIGGKMETTDVGLVEASQREKNEEIGQVARVEICITTTYPVLFRKKNGTSMIVPHHVARFLEGDIVLNKSEYSEYRWVPIADLQDFEPKVENISEVVQWALKQRSLLEPVDFQII